MSCLLRLQRSKAVVAALAGQQLGRSCKCALENEMGSGNGQRLLYGVLINKGPRLSRLSRLPDRLQHSLIASM